MRHTILALLVGLTITFSAAQQACNCCTENHEAFDFWIGSWTVTNPDGSLAGFSSITKIENNCIIDEHWKSASPGYTGTSHNFYNSKLKRWEQLWLDNQGGYLKLYGNRTENQMILTSDIENTQKGSVYHRITWTANEDGTVSQLWETITNETEISVAFNGLYTKKE